MDRETVQQNEPDVRADITQTGSKLPITQQLIVMAVLLLVIFGTGYMPKLIDYIKGNKVNDLTVSLTTEPPQAEPAAEIASTSLTSEPFERVRTTATSAFVWDVNKQRILYEKNPDKQLPLASITKLMTALVAHEILADGKSVTIPLSAIEQDGESGFSDGESFTLEALTDLTLMSSSNDGAFAIASAAGAFLNDTKPTTSFVQAMNVRAKELGLTQVEFRNPTGLDLSETEVGALGSARDVAFLIEYILKHQPAILERTTLPEAAFYNQSGTQYATENTNQYVNDISGLIGSKTGYTELAGGNLAVVFDVSLNRPIIVVVLGSTYQGRFNDVLALTEAARTAVQ